MRRLVASFLLLVAVAFSQTAAKSAAKQSASKAAAKAPAKAGAPVVTKAPAGNPTAVIHTTAGDLTCEIFKDKVPNAAGNFIGLAMGTKDWTDPKTAQPKHGVPLYDGTIFHRVIPEFMIQGGDPVGTGRGDPGYKINDEFGPGLKFDKPGVLAYANSGPNTNGSQFFITEVETPHLDPCSDDAGCERTSPRGSRHVDKGYGYTIFGQCTPESVELVKKIAREPRDILGGTNRPTQPVVINHIEIKGLAPAPKAVPAPVKRPSTATKTPAKAAPKKQP